MQLTPLRSLQRILSLMLAFTPNTYNPTNNGNPGNGSPITATGPALTNGILSQQGKGIVLFTMRSQKFAVQKHTDLKDINAAISVSGKLGGTNAYTGPTNLNLQVTQIGISNLLVPIASNTSGTNGAATNTLPATPSTATNGAAAASAAGAIFTDTTGWLDGVVSVLSGSVSDGRLQRGVGSYVGHLRWSNCEFGSCCRTCPLSVHGRRES